MIVDYIIGVNQDDVDMRVSEKFIVPCRAFSAADSATDPAPAPFLGGG